MAETTRWQRRQMITGCRLIKMLAMASRHVLCVRQLGRLDAAVAAAQAAAAAR